MNNILGTLALESTIWARQNISFGRDPVRRLVSFNWASGDTTSLNTTHSSTSIGSLLLAYYLSLVKPDIMSYLYNSTEYSVEARIADHNPLSAVVGVTCQSDSPSVYNRSYVLDLGVDDEKRLYNTIHPLGYGQSGLGTKFYLDVRNVWNESFLANVKQTTFTWRDVTTTEDNPALPALLLRPADQYAVASLTLCSIQASWLSTYLWALPAVSTDPETSFDTTLPLGPIVDGGKLQLYCQISNGSALDAAFPSTTYQKTQ